MRHRSIGLISFCAVLYVAASDRGLTESKDGVQNLVYGMSGFGLELILTKLEAMEYRLQKIESMQLQLQKIEDKIQEHQSTQEQIFEALKEHQSSQEQCKKEVFAVLNELENQVALNLSEDQNRDQEVRTALQKLDQDIEHVLYQYDQSIFSSCEDVRSKVSGTYLIRVNRNSEPFEVYCEQESYGGGWIVFQFRYDGSLDFYRGWNEFRDGFGDLSKEFWLGLEKLHQITSGRKHELVVELKDFNGTYKYARYGAFEIGSESAQYVLKNIGKYSGTAGNGISNFEGMEFSTKDRDNDKHDGGHCAQDREGAWWHSACTYTNLNGRYMNAVNVRSMYWWNFNTEYDGLSYSRMMIRELQ